MKALLLLEFETFMKKKQYILPLLYIVFSIFSLLYIVNKKPTYDNFLIILFSINLITEFTKREQSMKGTVRLFPVSAKERINTLFLEIFILNMILIVGLSISYFPFKDVGQIWVVLNIIVLIEALVIPDILPVEIWHQNYFQHLLMMLIAIGVSILVYVKTDIHPVIQFLGYATVLYALAYISSIRILTNKDW